ncbi:hypothetical protein M501DRAFT_926771 [Patellaria atrata CBS 101060]|uniref:Protein BNI4 n=1 Tax=Patellaria atrata CBS 101060 TaxID=1346257 RepID=A0A9P4SKA7_9PEZI|nr:hypothetical protein M501DRAFT_926771 [Patellaria atrata CBS 101060]
MAQVLAPILQTTTPMTLLHSSTDPFQTNSSGQTSAAQPPRSSQMPRTHLYNGQNAGGYRGTSTPVAPYAFQSTPHLRQESRTISSSSNSYGQQAQLTPLVQKAGHVSSSSNSTISSAASSNRSATAPHKMSRDDSVISTAQRSQGSLDTKTNATMNLTLPDLNFSSFDVTAKPSPDRYRRGQRQPNVTTSSATKSATPSGSGMAAVAHLYDSNGNSSAARPAHLRTSSADDMQLPRHGQTEHAKRYRRRSVGGFEPNTYPESALISTPPLVPKSQPTWASIVAGRADGKENKPPAPAPRPDFYSNRNTSRESLSSTNSAQRPSSRPSSSAPRQESRNVNVPPRESSNTSKRMANPSPLSQPAIGMDSDTPQPSPNKPTMSQAPSPAMQHLTALNDKDLNKGMKSRLRRAFSFGSAAELRRASAENSLSAERAKLRKEKYQTDKEAAAAAEEEAIIAKQEAAGIGAGIYSGQGGLTGSTDNVSISSTASSASIMLRKMGKGMKKGGRSIKGLFRPKSVIGVPAADGPVTQPSVAQVSMVTVEAEREKVNVNLNPHDQIGGGTGFPKLERNSIETGALEKPSSSNGSGIGADTWTRKSIVGGDRERQEVLATMGQRKGILKRPGSNNSSPVIRPADHKAPDLGLPQIPHVSDTPNSSGPTTPADDNRVNIGGEDYFVGVPKFSSSTKSLPNTPQGGSRNISFSPRIMFHDAWSSSEYDRRGDIATCNRLTPMLAQQIKEELNSFKMEMEVHEDSKPHTHFF